MTTLRPVLLGVTLLSTGCAAFTTYRGRTNALPASVDAEPGRVLVRPNEVAWVMGDAVSFEHTLDPSTIGHFTSNGSVMAGPDTPPLPDAVELAAAREVLERKADGLVVTHYVQEQVDAETLVVRVWGRLLRMDDLGPMSPERADLRRMIGSMERMEPAASTPRHDLLRGLGRPVAARPAPRAAPKQDNTRVGFEIGPVTGLVIDMADKSPVVDATSVRFGMAVSVIGGTASLDVVSLAYQVEFIEDFLLQPVVGVAASLSLYEFSSVYPTVQGIVGVEIDSEGPFEARVGARSGAAIGGAGAALTPDVSVGWVW